MIVLDVHGHSQISKHKCKGSRKARHIQSFLCVRPLEGILILTDETNKLQKLQKFKKVESFKELKDCAPVGRVLDLLRLICLTAYMPHYVSHVSLALCLCDGVRMCRLI